MTILRSNILMEIQRRCLSLPYSSLNIWGISLRQNKVLSFSRKTYLERLSNKKGTNDQKNRSNSNLEISNGSMEQPYKIRIEIRMQL